MVESTLRTNPHIEASSFEDKTSGQSHQAVNISQSEKLFSKVGGSALVLAGLMKGKAAGLLLTAIGGTLVYRGWTGHCHAYDALGIDTAEHGDNTAVAAQQGLKVEHAVTINRSASELFAFWRQLENLPKVMRHLQSVETLADGRSRWTAKGPMGKVVSWEAEVINEREPELIAWRSLPGSEVQTAGSIHFQELGHDRGTVVTVAMKYNPPAGKLGAAIAALFGKSAGMELDEDLRRFKSVMEAGEAPTTHGQPQAE